jgi:peptidoglycan/xylan/chitin deacetylase (PgdA/CDA1 family)
VIFSGENISIKSIVADPNALVTIHASDGSLVYSQTVAANSTISFQPPIIYGLFTVDCKTSYNTGETWFWLQNTNGLHSLSLPYTWTWRGITYTLSQDYSLQAELSGKKISVEWLSEISTKLKPSVLVEQNDYGLIRIRTYGKSISADSWLMNTCFGLKIRINGTLSTATMFRWNYKAIIGQALWGTNSVYVAASTGNLVYDFGDMNSRSTGISYSVDKTARKLNVNLAKTFDVDPYISSDGFESGDFTAWTNTAGTVAVVTSPVHSGTYAAQATGSGSLWRYYDTSAPSDSYFRGYLYFPSVLPSGSYVSVFDDSDVNWANEVVVSYDVSGTTSEWNLEAPSGTTHVTATIAASTWYCIEVERKVGSGNGVATLWVNGVQLAQRTAETFALGTYHVESGALWTDKTGFIVYGDEYVADSSYIGPLTNPLWVVSTVSDIFVANWNNFVNVTVTDMNGRTDVSNVTIQVYTVGDAQNFILEWNQVTNTFSEYSDPSGIVTINAAGSSNAAYSTNGWIVNFNFKFTPGFTSGACRVVSTVADTSYSAQVNNTSLFNVGNVNRVFVTFDDGTVDQYTNATPIMNTYSITATFYIIYNDVDSGGSDYMDWSQVATLISDGYEMGSHTRTHTDLNSVSASQLTDETVTVKNDFLVNHNVVTLTFDYPSGDGYDNATVTSAVTSAGYLYARTAGTPWSTWSRSNTTFTAISSFGVYDTTSFTNWKSLVNQAYNDSEVILYYHDVGTANAVTVGNFTQQMAYLHNKGFTTLPMSQVGSGIPITFLQTGIASGTAGTVLTLNGRAYSLTQFPIGLLCNSGDGQTVAASTPISVSAGEQYAFSSWTNGDGLSGASGTYTTPGAAITVTANYNILTTQTTQTSTNTTASITSTTTTSTSTTTTNASTSTTSTISSPATVSITLAANPSGSIVVDGTTYTSQQTFTWIPGSSHTITANSPVPGDSGAQYVWASWADGGNQSRTITTPSSPTTYTANYQTQYQVTYSQTGCSLSVSLPATEWVNAGGSAVGVFPSTVPSSDGKTQCLLQNASPPGPINAPTALAATYKTQYYLTVTSSYGNPTGQGWYDPGSTATFAVTSPAGGGAGTQYAFTGWGSSDTGGYTGADASHSFTVNSPISEAASWKTQWQVAFAVNPSGAGSIAVSGQPSATAWYDNGAVINVQASHNTGYAFSSWSGDVASITFANSTSSSTTVTIHGAGTITARFALADTTPPVITSTVTPNANSNGWNNGPVTVSWSVSDPESGIASSNGCATTTLRNETPLAGTTLTCTVTNGAGLSNSASVTVKIDLTAPILTLQSLTVEATGSRGAPVSYTASASDSLSGLDTFSCTPASGSMFPLGKSTVSCSAKDKAGNALNGTFSVTVQDKTPPVLTVPADMIVEATSSKGAAVTFTASAVDLVDGSLTPTCTPTSGSTFALGSTKVTCSVKDKVGNTASASFKVTVADRTPPKLQLPADMTAPATSAKGAVVKFSASATDLVDGSVRVTCTPASGSTFPFGTTTVSCSAKDNAGNSASGSFKVTVPMVTVTLLASNGSGLSGAVVQYYSDSWKAFGTTGSDGTAKMGLASGTYNFQISWAGATQQKSQNVGTNPNVVFQTTLVTVKLVSSANLQLSGGAQYYADSWKTFGSGTTTATMELLPLTYTFQISWAGASQQISQNVATNPNVIFKTVQVHSDSGKCTSYYAGGWKTFTQNMELLPGTYTFRFSDGTRDTSYTLVVGAIKHIH